MSAVLSSPFNQIPLLQSLYSEIEILKSRFCKIESELTELKAENTELKATIIEQAELIANSLKRNTRIENVIFSHDEEGDLVEDETGRPVLSEALTVTTETPATPETATTWQNTLTGIRAKYTVLHLEQNILPNSFGEVVLDSHAFKVYLTERIHEEYRVKDSISNMRKLKNDVFKEAVKQHPNKVFISKSKKGNQETCLVLKEMRDNQV